MPIPIIAFFIVLLLGLILLTTYFSAFVLLKVIRALFASFSEASLPNSIKRSLREARDYAERIRRTVQQHPPGPVRDRLDLTIQPVDEWLTSLKKLEQALAKMYSQGNLARELRRVDSDISQLHRRLLLARGQEAKALQSLLGSKKKHYLALKELESFQNEAELKIRKIGSDLGSTHAEMVLVTARGDFNDNRLQRLDENLQDHVDSIKDMLAAMDEMGYRSATSW